MWGTVGTVVLVDMQSSVVSKSSVLSLVILELISSFFALMVHFLSVSGPLPVITRVWPLPVYL